MMHTRKGCYVHLSSYQTKKEDTEGCLTDTTWFILRASVSTQPPALHNTDIQFKEISLSITTHLMR